MRSMSDDEEIKRAARIIVECLTVNDISMTCGIVACLMIFIASMGKKGCSNKDMIEAFKASIKNYRKWKADETSL